MFTGARGSERVQSAVVRWGAPLYRPLTGCPCYSPFSSLLPLQVTRGTGLGLALRKLVAWLPLHFSHHLILVDILQSFMYICFSSNHCKILLLSYDNGMTMNFCILDSHDLPSRDCIAMHKYFKNRGLKNLMNPKEIFCHVSDMEVKYHDETSFINQVTSGNPLHF